MTFYFLKRNFVILLLGIFFLDFQLYFEIHNWPGPLYRECKIAESNTLIKKTLCDAHIVHVTSHHQSSWKVNLINLFNWKLGGLQKEWRKISWKLLFLVFFLVICQTGWRILLFLDCVVTFILPLKWIKTLFTYFNH